MTIKQTIRTFLLQNFLFTDDESVLKDGDSFLDAGIIDSTGVLEIIFFIEETFGIKVSDAEMLPENFDSVDCLAAYIEHKQSAAASAGKTL